jgi:hydrogenase maturation protein HypF
MPPLVMTSGNPSEEPIVTTNRTAVRTLGSLADLLLVHDRGIHTGCDDSVAQVVRGRPRLLRRSRGYVPRPIEPKALGIRQPVLAVGGELKCAIAVARRGQLVPGRHLGDLTNARAYESFVAEIGQLCRILGVEPRVVAHDLHPDYLSTRYAASLEGVELVGVQHHHGHMASCLVENDVGEDETVVAVVFDGTGFGTDGTVWGGEFLVGGYRSFRRAAHLRRVALPGGDRAIRSPFRTAFAHLLDAFGDEALELDLPVVASQDRSLLEDMARMIRAGLNSPLSSGAGRLFDAAAGIAGIRSATSGEITYEAQAAMELEAVAEGEGAPYPFERQGEEVDTRPIVRALADDARRGAGRAAISARFHATMAGLCSQVAADLAAEAGTRLVALSGGCFSNRRLSAAVESQLESRGLRVLTHARVPAGDGGLSLGQAAIACARSERS